MKRLIIGLVSILGMLWVTSAIADMQEKTVQVKLVVQQIISLDVTAPDTVVPTAEDYAQDQAKYSFVPGCTGSADANKGFADRHDAISVTMFTNARKGATVHFAGNPSASQGNSLQNKDVFLSVMREKTYVLNNSSAGQSNLAVTGGIDGAWAAANTSIDTVGTTQWIQSETEARRFFGVTERTEAARLWVLKLGIANLTDYTENANGYTMDLTFILMPEVV